MALKHKPLRHYFCQFFADKPGQNGPIAGVEQKRIEIGHNGVIEEDSPLFPHYGLCVPRLSDSKFN